MGRVFEPASSYWEVDRRSNDNSLRPFCVVILRNKKNKKSVVKASSSDFESMQAYAEVLRQDLEQLSNEEFINKYNLKMPA